MNVLAERALNSVEQGLLNAPPAALGFKPPKSQKQSKSSAQNEDADQPTPAERAKDEVESGTHQLETLLCASIDRNFDKFELYVLRNIFTVRPPELCNWIRLSHYDGLDFSSSATTNRRRQQDQTDQSIAPAPKDTPTIESITALRRRLRESMRLNALLTAERARNEVLLEDLRRLVGDPASGQPQVKDESASASPEHRRSVSRQRDASVADGTLDDETKKKNKSPFSFLHQKGDLASSGGGAAAPLATTAAFTLSQMQALRALSTALSNIAPDLKTSTSATTGQSGGGGADDGDDDVDGQGAGARGWRRERVAYVETATRRHLEMVHGLELGRHGEVRDGEWQGPGRNLARGEVESLERVAAMLGGDGNGNGNNENDKTSSTGARAGAGTSLSKPAQQEEEEEQVEGEEDRMDES